MGFFFPNICGFFSFLFTKQEKEPLEWEAHLEFRPGAEWHLSSTKSTPRASIHPVCGDFDLCQSGRCSHEQLSFQHRGSRCAQRTALETTKQHGRLSRGTQSPSCQTRGRVVALISCSSIQLKCKAPLLGRTNNDLSSVAECALQSSLSKALHCSV